MRDSIISRLTRIEKMQSTLPRAIVTFSDGHKERLNIHDIAVAFFDRNAAGIKSVEWERSSNGAVIFQLLSSAEIWENLTTERNNENETN